MFFSFPGRRRRDRAARRPHRAQPPVASAFPGQRGRDARLHSVPARPGRAVPGSRPGPPGRRL